MLRNEEIPDFTLEDVCVERMLMAEDEDEEADIEDDESGRSGGCSAAAEAGTQRTLLVRQRQEVQKVSPQRGRRSRQEARRVAAGFLARLSGQAHP